MRMILYLIANQREAEIAKSAGSLPGGTLPAMDGFLRTADTGYFPGLM